MIPLHFKPELYRFKSLSSTNDKLRELALAGVPEGTLVVAEEQTQGRGRLGRRWHSPPGGFYLSALLYPLTPKQITDLPFLMGVSVVQTLNQLLPKLFEVSLKWPNDVLVNDQKIAGILSEAFGENEFYGGIVGVGININTPAKELTVFEKQPFQATSFHCLVGAARWDLDEVLEIFQAKLFSLYRFYQEKGFAPIRALWEKNCSMLGKHVQIKSPEFRSGEIQGVFIGLSDRGGLILDTGKTGEKTEVLSGDLACSWS